MIKVAQLFGNNIIARKLDISIPQSFPVTIQRLDDLMTYG